MIRVKCPKPNCHNHTEVNEIFIGRPVRCIKCGTSFIVKSPAPIPRSAPKPMEPAPLPALADTHIPSLADTPMPSAAFSAATLQAPPMPEPEIAEVEVVDSEEWEVPSLDEYAAAASLSEETFGADETEPGFLPLEETTENRAFNENDSLPDGVMNLEPPETETAETAPVKRGGRRKSGVLSED